MIRRHAAPFAGLAVAGVGWSLGSAPVALAGGTLLAAGALGTAWVALARRSVTLERGVSRTALVEGDQLEVDVVLRGGGRPAGEVRLRERLGERTAPDVRLRRDRPTRVSFSSLPRGVHRLGPATIELRDPLGLAQAQVALAPGQLVRVRPRAAALAGTFLDAGTGPGGRGRSSALRASGTEPHGVRTYRDGESLRAVHWPSSARTGRLMVREMEELSREDVTVVVDLALDGAAGPPGASSMDEAARVAASLVREQAARGRQVGLVLAGPEPTRIGIQGLGRGWEDALDALAGAAPTARPCTAAVLANGVGRDALLVLVTARAAAPFAEALLRRGRCAVVSIDAPTYAGSARAGRDAGLMRLAAHGVPIAVVRSGDDLGAVLSSRRMAAGA